MTANWIVAHMKWVMIVSGALTCTMIYAAISPGAAMSSTFGESPDGPAAQLVVRSWGVLIALVGGLLIFGAYHPSSRPLILTVAGLSKITFICLVLAHGTKFLGHQAGVAVLSDSVMVLLFAGYLMGAQRSPKTTRGSR